MDKMIAYFEFVPSAKETNSEYQKLLSAISEITLNNFFIILSNLYSVIYYTAILIFFYHYNSAAH
jgi:hypothetical protein